MTLLVNGTLATVGGAQSLSGMSASGASVVFNALGTAAALVESTANAAHQAYQSLGYTGASVDFYYYVELMAALRTAVRILIGTDPANFAYADFNLSGNSIIGHGDAGDSSTVWDTNKIITADMGDGFKKVRIGATTGGGTPIYCGVQSLGAANAATFAGDNTQNAFYFRNIVLNPQAGDPN